MEKINVVFIPKSATKVVIFTLPPPCLTMFKIKFARMFQESRGDVASALFVNRGLKARQNVNPFTLSQSGSAVRRKFDRCGIMQN